MNEPTERYRSFSDFYPFYMSEHTNQTSRRLHVVGTGLAVALIVVGMAWNWRLLWLAPIAGYGFAWIGHLVFEKNRPATFRYPLWSLTGDLLLFFQTITRQRRF